MLTQNRGEYAKSLPYSWSNGGTVIVDTNFLRSFAARMQAPVIDHLLIHVEGAGSAGSGGTNGEDFYHLLSRITVKDKRGIRYDLPGKLARVFEQCEYGDMQQEDVATQASGSTSADYDHFVRIPFAYPKAYRPADTALPVPYLTEGGEIKLQFGTPKNLTMGSWTAIVYAWVVDERRREAKSRAVVQEVSITNAQDNYLVKGSLRWAIHSSDLAGATLGYTTLAGITEIDSKVLNYADLVPDIVRQEYRQAMGGSLASDDECVAATPNAIPVFFPEKGQRNGRLPDLDSFDYKFNGSVPASSKMITCVIEDRQPSLAAEWMGYRTPQDFLAAVDQFGKVSGKGKKRGHVKNWDDTLVARLPLRIDPDQE